MKPENVINNEFSVKVNTHDFDMEYVFQDIQMGNIFYKCKNNCGAKLIPYTSEFKTVYTHYVSPFTENLTCNEMIMKQIME